MKKKIEKAYMEVNSSMSKDKLSYGDIGTIMLYLHGCSKEVSYYSTKCNGPMSDSVLSEKAENFFKAKKVVRFIDLMADEFKVKDVGDMSSVNWKTAHVDGLSPEELEKMATYMLRQSAKAKDVDTKEILDLIKMLDNVGALPKKRANEEDGKQVVMLMPYNELCMCGREVAVTEEMYDEYARKNGWKVEKIDDRLNKISKANG